MRNNKNCILDLEGYRDLRNMLNAQVNQITDENEKEKMKTDIKGFLDWFEKRNGIIM